MFLLHCLTGGLVTEACGGFVVAGDVAFCVSPGPQIRVMAKFQARRSCAVAPRGGRQPVSS